MSVNMLRLRVRTDCQPRTKNGHPPHSTTGVARRSCAQVATSEGMASYNGSMRCRPISSRTTGTVRTAPIQKRRVMSRSSAEGPVSAVTTTGSRAMPQIGHDPGPS